MYCKIALIYDSLCSVTVKLHEIAATWNVKARITQFHVSQAVATQSWLQNKLSYSLWGGSSAILCRQYKSTYYRLCTCGLHTPGTLWLLNLHRIHYCFKNRYPWSTGLYVPHSHKGLSSLYPQSLIQKPTPISTETSKWSPQCSPLVSGSCRRQG